MPSARCARSLACEIKQAHERSHHGHTGNHPAFPAQWFYGLLRALPGDQACLTPSSALLIADLTPASGRQNDTTWPYASASFVRLAFARLTLPRPPHPSEISEFQKIRREAFSWSSPATRQDFGTRLGRVLINAHAMSAFGGAGSTGRRTAHADRPGARR